MSQTKARGEGPFGPAQTKLFKFMLQNPGCTFTEIKEKLFNDKKNSYVSNLLYENENLIKKDQAQNTEFPDKYFVRIKPLVELGININSWIKEGKLITSVENTN